MMQFEKLDNYMEGRRRNVSLQDPDILNEYVQGGTKPMERASIDGKPANFADHPSLMEARSKFLPKRPPMPFEVSRTIAVFYGQKHSLGSEVYEHPAGRAKTAGP